MLKLDAPITIFPEVYDGLKVVRAHAVDLRRQIATVFLAPVQSTEEVIRLGRKEQTGEKIEYLFPQMTRPFTIRQNLRNPDPRIQEIMQGFAEVLEKIEAFIVETQNEEGGLITQAYQIGVTKWDLHCTYEPNGGRVLGVEERNVPKKEDRKDGDSEEKFKQ